MRFVQSWMPFALPRGVANGSESNRRRANFAFGDGSARVEAESFQQRGTHARLVDLARAAAAILAWHSYNAVGTAL